MQKSLLALYVAHAHVERSAGAERKSAFGFVQLHAADAQIRQHAIRHYLDLVRDGRVDIADMLTHRYPLDRWHDALRVLADQQQSGAVKVAFEPVS